MASAGAGETYVVVGGGMAGASAVETLRREGFAGRIVLVGAEPHLPYERPPLSKELLIGAIPEAKIFPRDAAFYTEQRIETQLAARAVGLDTRARTVALAGGTELRYDRLLIATGGEARRLAVPGADLPGVMYLRTLEDARLLAAALRARAEQGGHVVIVGAGFIGAEVASGCRQLGIAVTMLEILPVPLGRALGDQIGAIYAAIHQAHGVDLRLGEGVAEMRGTGRVEEVVTTAGATVPCGLVVVGVGMRPADEWLRASGLALGDGVLVDAYCQTSASGVFAAGDVASWPYGPEGQRVRLEHYDNALRQGEAAARNMLGQQRPYTPVPYFWSDQYGLRLQYVGHARAWDQMALRGQPGEGSFMAFYLEGGRLRAALAMNQMRELGTLKRLVAAGLSPDPAALADEGQPLRSLLPPVG
jgi:3-phenylpropionate/trans-cinnamate dioxygenase ferredoxin reductase subunit